MNTQTHKHKEHTHTHTQLRSDVWSLSETNPLWVRRVVAVRNKPSLCVCEWLIKRAVYDTLRSPHTPLIINEITHWISEFVLRAASQTLQTAVSPLNNVLNKVQTCLSLKVLNKSNITRTFSESSPLFNNVLRTLEHKHRSWNVSSGMFQLVCVLNVTFFLNVSDSK